MRTSCTHEMPKILRSGNSCSPLKKEKTLFCKIEMAHVLLDEDAGVKKTNNDAQCAKLSCASKLKLKLSLAPTRATCCDALLPFVLHRAHRLTLVVHSWMSRCFERVFS